MAGVLDFGNDLKRNPTMVEKNCQRNALNISMVGVPYFESGLKTGLTMGGKILPRKNTEHEGCPILNVV